MKSSDTAPESASEISDVEQQLLEIFRSLSDDKRNRFMSTLVEAHSPDGSFSIERFTAGIGDN